MIFSYFGSFMVVWGLGFWGWGLILGFLGLGFSVDGPVVWGLLGFLGWGSLYEHKRITLGKNGAQF